MYILVFLKLIISSWRANLKLVIFSIICIALGVALVLAVINSNESILEQFNYSNNLIQGKQSAQIESIDGSLIDENQLPANLINQLRDFEYTPCLELNLYESQSQQTIKVLGVDLLNDYQFRNYGFTESNPEFSNLLDPKTGGLLVSESLLQQLNWTGEQHNLSYQGKQIPFVINKLIKLKDLGIVKAENGLIAITDLAYLRETLGLQGKLSSIQFKNNLADELKQKLSIPDSLTLKPSSDRKEEITKLTEAFRFNLQALSFIALLVAGYLISQTIFISLKRKIKTLGIIRVLGFSKKQSLTLVIIESLLIGVLGVSLGCLLGVLLSKEILKALSATVNELYFSSKATQLIFSSKGFLVAGSVGLVCCLVSCIPSTLLSLSVPPAINLRSLSFQNLKSVSNNLIFKTTLFAILASLLLIVFKEYLYQIPNRYFGFLMALIALGSLSLFAGFILKTLHSLFACLRGWFASFFIARFSANFIRLWIASGALICGLTMTISISIMIDSFRDTVKDWIHDTIKGDIYVSAKYTGGSLNPQLIELSRSWPEIKAIDYLSKHQTQYNGKPVIIGGANIHEQLDHLNFIELLPKTSKLALKELFKHSNNFVLVSNTFAIKHKIQAGQKLKLASKLGPVQPVVAGIYQDYSSEHGYILMKRETYTKLFNNQQISNLAFYLNNPSQTQEVKNKFLKIAEEELQISNLLKVQSNQELKKTILKIFDQTFYISYLFFWIALIISILTVSLTLLSCIEENKDLNETSYFLGTSSQQIFVLEMSQGLIITLTAIALSIPGGYWLSEILQQTINNHSFGWIIYLHPNWLNIFMICLLAFVGALLASFLQIKQIYSGKSLASRSLASLS